MTFVLFESSRRTENETRIQSNESDARATLEDAFCLSLLFSRINRARDFVNKREESARILLFFAFFPPESTQGKIFGESSFRVFVFSYFQRPPKKFQT